MWLLEKRDFFLWGKESLEYFVNIVILFELFYNDMYYKIVKLLGDIVCSLVIDKRMGFYFCNVKMNVLYSKIYFNK